MYIISAMILSFSIRDFGHPKFLKSQFGHPVMNILAKSLLVKLDKPYLMKLNTLGYLGYLCDL